MSDGQYQEISPATAQVGPLPATDFPTIYRLLVKLDYRQQDEIQDLERQLYLLLKENPENINGLIILMQEQIIAANTRKPNRWPIKSGTWAEKCRRRWKLCLSAI